MKIIYFGCDPFISCFEQLIKDGHEIVTLFTFHNPHDWYSEEKITQLAKINGVPIRYDRIPDWEADQLFAVGACDAFLSAEYNWKIPVPARPDFKGVNIHNMLLPESPGFFPIETQLYLRRPYGGITLHKMTSDYDEGDVLYSERYELPVGIEVEEAYARCAEIAKRAVSAVFSNLAAAWENARPQRGRRLTQPISVRERTIDNGFTKDDALHLWRCFRTYTYAVIGGVTYRVLDMKPYENRAPAEQDYIWLNDETGILTLRGGAVCLRVEKK